MAYQIVTFGSNSCPANSTQYPANWFSVSGGNIVSVGFQNEDLSPSLVASQAFANTATTFNVQVVNNGSSAVSWTAFAIVDIGTGPNVSAVNTAVTTASA